MRDHENSNLLSKESGETMSTSPLSSVADHSVAYRQMCCDYYANIQNIRVVARVRPLPRKELNRRRSNNNYKNSLKEDENSGTIIVNKRKFQYDGVFGPEATQRDFYDKIDLQGMIHNNLFRGFNLTVIAYGQTGSGKTHTIFGKNTTSHQKGSVNNDSNGVIPRAINDIFNYISEMDNGPECVKVEMSYLEIYNEEVKDLLDLNSGKQLFIREDKVEGGVVVQNLSRHRVGSRKEIADLMKSACGRRATAAIRMNKVSSRSHAICTFYVTVSDPVTEEETTAKLSLVDLAGSERLKRTGAAGTRLKEGININKGLFVLGQVVSALSKIEQLPGSIENNSSNHVNYRDSKLTRLLQDSLGGNCKTIMVACISPLESNVQESMNTLRYAERAGNIRTSATRNIVATSMSPMQIVALQKENQRLKLQLFQTQTKLNSRTSTPLDIVISDSTQSVSNSDDDTVENFYNNGLDLRKLDILSKLKVQCSSMKDHIEQLEHKAQSSVENSLKAAIRADKWQLKCEELMTTMKRHCIPYPDAIKNEGRFQSLNIVNTLRKQLNERSDELRNAKIDAGLSRAAAAVALFNGNEDESIQENVDLMSEIRNAPNSDRQ